MGSRSEWGRGKAEVIPWLLFIYLEQVWVRAPLSNGSPCLIAVGTHCGLRLREVSQYLHLMNSRLSWLLAVPSWQISDAS